MPHIVYQTEGIVLGDLFDVRCRIRTIFVAIASTLNFDILGIWLRN